MVTCLEHKNCCSRHADPSRPSPKAFDAIAAPVSTADVIGCARTTTRLLPPRKRRQPRVRRHLEAGSLVKQFSIRGEDLASEMTVVRTSSNVVKTRRPRAHATHQSAAYDWQQLRRSTIGNQVTSNRVPVVKLASSIGNFIGPDNVW